MYLVQLLLPLSDNDGRPFGRGEYDVVRDALTERFGGVTAYSRAPAEGLWKESEEAAVGGGAVVRDDLIVYEVMVEEIDRGWWAGFRESVRRRFRQEELVVRATPMERL
jgi:hypothetical protein